jgi:hypothetical protein
MSWEDAPRRTTSRRGMVVGVLLAVAAVAVLALLAVRRDGPPTALTVGPSERPPGGPPPDDAAFVPQRLDPIDVTDEASGSGSLLPDPDADLTIIAADGDELLLLDTASGDRRRIEVAPVVLDDVIAVIGDDLVVEAGSDVVRLADDQIRPLRLAEDHLLVPTVADDAVWIYSGGTPYADGTATLLGLDGRVRDHVAMPAVALPLAGTGDRLIVDTPAGVAVVDRDGGRTVARGTALATDGDRLAWLDCDGGLSCAVVVGTVDDPDQVRATLDAADLPAGFAGLPIGAFSPDGRWLALPLYRTDEQGRLEQIVLSVLDTATGAEVFRTDGTPARPRGTPLAWSPDSRWLVFASGGNIRGWQVDGDRAVSIATDVGTVDALAVR